MTLISFLMIAVIAAVLVFIIEQVVRPFYRGLVLGFRESRRNEFYDR